MLTAQTELNRKEQYKRAVTKTKHCPQHDIMSGNSMKYERGRCSTRALDRTAVNITQMLTPRIELNSWVMVSVSAHRESDVTITLSGHKDTGDARSTAQQTSTLAVCPPKLVSFAPPPERGETSHFSKIFYAIEEHCMSRAYKESDQGKERPR